MSNIKVVVDSGSDITQDEAGFLGIEVIPLKTRFGCEEFRDGVDINAKQFYDRLIESDELPATSQVNPHQYEEAFRKAQEEGQEVLCITIAEKLSGCYRSAVLAAQEFEHVHVFDSTSATIGEKAMVMQALKYIKEGLNMEAILNRLEEDRNHLVVLAIVDTLEYLKKGGRISAAAAVAGSLLSIKPVISLIDGVISVIGKAHGSKKAKNMLTEKIAERGGIRFDKAYCLAYSGNENYMLMKYLEDNRYLLKDAPSEEVPILQIGPAIGTHVGPGAIGVAFFTEN